MSTIKVNNVIPPNAGEGVTIDGLQMPTAGPLSNRNLIINGRFRVDQRYNGSAATLQSGYTVDRFRVHGPTANQFTVDQQTTGVRVTCAAVGAFGHFGTPLEQQDLLPYLGQKMTISFKVRGSTSISQTLDFNDMPTPTSGTAISLDSSTYNVTTSWQTVTRTFTMPSSLSYACVYVSLLQVNSSNMAVNDWVELDEVQLEAGEKNTPFEHRSYGDELQRCMRYYERGADATFISVNDYWSGQTTASVTYARRNIMYRQIKRDVPTTIIVLNVDRNGFPTTSPTVTQSHAGGVGWYLQSNSTTNDGYLGVRWTADAEL